MANSLTTNPIVVDTANAGAALIASGQPLLVSAIKAVGLTTAGHTGVVQDANGKAFWECIAATTNYATQLETFAALPNGARTLNGLKVPTLASGKIYIWVG